MSAAVTPLVVHRHRLALKIYKLRQLRFPAVQSIFIHEFYVLRVQVQWCNDTSLSLNLLCNFSNSMWFYTIFKTLIFIQTDV